MSDQNNPKPGPEALAKLLREITSGGQGAMGLNLQAEIERALGPTRDAVDRLIKAIAADMRNSTPASRSAVSQAKSAYESLTQQAAEGELWADLVSDAQALVKRGG